MNKLQTKLLRRQGLFGLLGAGLILGGVLGFAPLMGTAAGTLSISSTFSLNWASLLTILLAALGGLLILTSVIKTGVIVFSGDQKRKTETSGLQLVEKNADDTKGFDKEKAAKYCNDNNMTLEQFINKEKHVEGLRALSNVTNDFLASADNVSSLANSTSDFGKYKNRLSEEDQSTLKELKKWVESLIIKFDPEVKQKFEDLVGHVRKSHSGLSDNQIKEQILCQLMIFVAPKWGLPDPSSLPMPASAKGFEGKNQSEHLTPAELNLGIKPGWEEKERMTHLKNACSGHLDRSEITDEQYEIERAQYKQIGARLLANLNPSEPLTSTGLKIKTFSDEWDACGDKTYSKAVVVGFLDSQNYFGSDSDLGQENKESKNADFRPKN